jgi:hypothetical protein
MAATGPTRPWLPQGERGQVGGLVGRAAERPGQLGRPQGVADLDPAAAAVVPAGRGRTARAHQLNLPEDPTTVTRGS